MLDLRAYCDESVTHDQAPNIFCIAGWVAHATEWRDFDKEWRRALKAESLTEFKAAQCAGGRGEYKGRSHADCHRTWRRFASILREMRTVGFGTIIDLDAYDGLANVFKAKRKPKYHDPYYLAFQQQIETMALRMAKMRRTERLSVFFDQMSESKADARAKLLYDQLKLSRKLTFVARLGSLTLDDSKHSPGVQAADLLAFEVRRHFREVVFPVHPSPVRDEWRFLQKRIEEVRFFEQTALTKLAGLL